MNGVNKVFADLGGKLVLVWSVEALQQSPHVQQIVIVVSSRHAAKLSNMLIEKTWTKVVSICEGGKRRQDSVAAGLAQITNSEWVIIHDGARPFLTQDLIEHGLEAAKETGAAIAAVAVTDTIKIAGRDMLVNETPLRKNLWAAQTPQVFRYDIIKEAYSIKRLNVTDDASLVEKAGYKVKLYIGSYDNIKITTPKDIVLAKAMLDKKLLKGNF